MAKLQNTYEESPEELKRVLDSAIANGNLNGNTNGTRAHQSNKSQLLKTHANNLRLLKDAPPPLRNFILPRPYPPSTISITDPACRRLLLSDIPYNTRDPSTILFAKSIVEPYVHSATITMIQDESGNIARLTIYNLEDSAHDPLLLKGTVVGIKQPCFSPLPDGGWHVQVDHPSDVVWLREGDEGVPQGLRGGREGGEKTAGEWKGEGDRAFVGRRWRGAVDAYSRAIEQSTKDDAAALHDLYRKKAGVNILLTRLDEAANDLSMAISYLPEAKSSYSTVFEDWLHNRCDLPNGFLPIPKGILDLSHRLKHSLPHTQPHPNYDFAKLSAMVSAKNPYLPVPSYFADTEVRQTASKGRGLFGKKDFEIGDIILVEKAFALPAYDLEDASNDCMVWNFGNDMKAPRPSALLLRSMVEKLRQNPSLHEMFFDLDAGPHFTKYAAPQGFPTKISHEQVPLDVFRTESIRQRNCFSAPLRSSDLLHTAPHPAQEEMRTGFWPRASYLNHACTANAVRTFIGDLFILRAIRRIPANTEITTQYLSPDVDLDRRQEQFGVTWGFTCTCDLCLADASVALNVRAERMALFEKIKEMVVRKGGAVPMSATPSSFIKKIARMTVQLEGTYPAEAFQTKGLPRLALVHPSLWVAETWHVQGNGEKAVEWAVRLLGGFGVWVVVGEGGVGVRCERGLVNVEVLRALMWVGEAVGRKGDVEVKEECLRWARGWYVCITGCEVGMREFFGE